MSGSGRAWHVIDESGTETPFEVVEVNPTMAYLITLPLPDAAIEIRRRIAEGGE